MRSYLNINNKYETFSTIKLNSLSNTSPQVTSLRLRILFRWNTARCPVHPTPPFTRRWAPLMECTRRPVHRRNATGTASAIWPSTLFTEAPLPRTTATKTRQEVDPADPSPINGSPQLINNRFPKPANRYPPTITRWHPLYPAWDRSHISTVSSPQHLSTPTMQIPTIQTPTMQIPTIQTPTMQIPTIQTLTIQTPIIQTPTMQTPTILPLFRMRAKEIYRVPRVISVDSMPLNLSKSRAVLARIFSLHPSLIIYNRCYRSSLTIVNCCWQSFHWYYHLHDIYIFLYP